MISHILTKGEFVPQSLSPSLRERIDKMFAEEE